MLENKNSKYIIYKDLYWNYPTNFENCSLDEISLSHIEKEKAMLQKAATLNFLANENLIKHKELVAYLEQNLGKSIDFKLNGEPYILADFQLRNPINNQNVKDILEIAEFGVYKVIELNKEYNGSYIALFSEEHGFESESGDFENFIYLTQTEAKIGVTKYIFHQMTNLHTNFSRIKEDKSKSSDFKSFIDDLKFFEFDEGYLLIQPKQETIKNIEFFNQEEILKVKSEIDTILNYTNSDAYIIQQI